MKILLFLTIPFLFAGCEGRALLKKANWESLQYLSQTKIEKAKEGYFQGDFDAIFGKIADMLQDGGAPIEKRSKADGLIETGEYSIASTVTQVNVEKAQGGVNVKWTLLMVLDRRQPKKLVNKTPEERADYNERMNYKLLKYLETGSIDE